MNHYLKRKAKEAAFVKHATEAGLPTTPNAEPRRHKQKSPKFKRPMTFGRSGSLIAVNDEYIRFFLKDPNYRVTEDGVIWTRISRQGHITNDWRPKPLVQKQGYQTFTYCKKNISVHRVVYAAVIGPLEPDLVINHIDCNRSNNHPSNLELVTQRINNAPPRYNLE